MESRFLTIWGRKMTLQDFVDLYDYLRKYVELLKISESKSHKTSPSSFFYQFNLKQHLEILLNSSLWLILKDEKWKEMLNLFHQRISFDHEAPPCKGKIITKGFTASQITDNEEIFFATLTEVCEPLLVKSGEEKGGQDAAKA